MAVLSKPDPSTLPLARFPEEWAAEAVRLGGRTFHGKSIFKWIHARGVTDASKMTDLPLSLRERLTAEGLTGVLSIVTERRATDDTRKLLVGMHDGANVETVLIPRVTGGRSDLPSPLGAEGDESFEDADAAAAVDDEDDEGETSGTGTGTFTGGQGFVPVTQCISTQVGCAMGCVFCASGVAGLKRHMRADEIIAQVLVGRSRLDANERIRNVVLMGMGEPLHNYDATVRALKLLSHPDGIALSNRKVTVSTSGLVPEIARLGQDFGGQVGLAISLHAADDETRSRLMPINKKYPLPVLMQALRDYPLPRRRRITIEYTLVAGKNDTVEEARKLARLLRGLSVKVNLIPMNPIEASTLGPPSLAGVLAFQRVLCDAGYSCFIRRRRGDDVSAACGQLALLGAKPKVRVNRS
ncbi:MAG: Ribosomal large subunit methyltransferase [Labilithrix sp.]|nr:Ribosomal large subunit methyltransferase [Labilithrix sp.]